MEFFCGQSAVLAASFLIDNLVTSGLAENVGGPTVIRRTIYTDAGVGFHSVALVDGGSTNVMLTRVIGYQPSLGTTLGVLAQIPIAQTFIQQNYQGYALHALAISPFLPARPLTG
jgi:hypothetical protein